MAATKTQKHTLPSILELTQELDIDVANLDEQVQMAFNSDNPNDEINALVAELLQDKVDGLYYYVEEELPAQIQKWKDFSKKLSELATLRQKQMESIKEMIKYHLGKQIKPGETSITVSGKHFSIKVADSTTPSIHVGDGECEQWGPEWSDLRRVTINYDPDKKAIAALVKQDKPIPPGVTPVYGKRLTMKPKK